MKRLRRRTTYLVEVTWNDAFTGQHSWQLLPDLAASSWGPYVCRSVGYVVGKERGRFGSIVLAQNVSDDGKGADTVTIPNGCIRRVRRLK